MLELTNLIVEQRRLENTGRGEVRAQLSMTYGRKFLLLTQFWKIAMDFYAVILISLGRSTSPEIVHPSFASAY